LVVENIPIKSVSIAGYLRVQISCNLSWALYICSKVKCEVGLLPRVFILLAKCKSAITVVSSTYLLCRELAVERRIKAQYKWQWNMQFILVIAVLTALVW